MSLTDSEREALALFAGGYTLRRGKYACWNFGTIKKPNRIQRIHWRPDEKPEQADLILRTLIKNHEISLYFHVIWPIQCEMDGRFIQEDVSWWPNAVCKAALALPECTII